MDKFYPKGSMCLRCVNRLQNCSGLPFHTMQVIETNHSLLFNNAPTYTVRCSSYEAETHPTDVHASGTRR
jgi:hypothetical protein